MGSRIFTKLEAEQVPIQARFNSEAASISEHLYVYCRFGRKLETLLQDDLESRISPVSPQTIFNIFSLERVLYSSSSEGRQETTKGLRTWRPFRVFSQSGFGYFAGFKAGGAHADALIGAVYPGVYRSQVHVPAPAAYVVGVADFVAKLRPFAADVAYLCHNKNSRLIDSEELQRRLQSAGLKVNSTRRYAVSQTRCPDRKKHQDREQCISIHTEALPVPGSIRGESAQAGVPLPHNLAGDRGFDAGPSLAGGDTFAQVEEWAFDSKIEQSSDTDAGDEGEG